MNPLGPFVLPWTNVQAGAYTLTARAKDNAGATATSAPVRITVTGGGEGLNAKINFQPAGSTVPEGYRADSGKVYGPREGGLSYGWNKDNQENTRDRNSQLSPINVTTRSRTATSSGADLGVRRAEWDVSSASGGGGSKLFCQRLRAECGRSSGCQRNTHQREPLAGRQCHRDCSGWPVNDRQSGRGAKQQNLLHRSERRRRDDQPAADGEHGGPGGRRDVHGAGQHPARCSCQRQRRNGEDGGILPANDQPWPSDELSAGQHAIGQSILPGMDECAARQLHADGQSDR